MLVLRRRGASLTSRSAHLEVEKRMNGDVSEKASTVAELASSIEAIVNRILTLSSCGTWRRCEMLVGRGWMNDGMGD